MTARPQTLTHPVQVRLPRPLAERVRVYAAEHEMTCSQVIRAAVKWHLGRAA